MIVVADSTILIALGTARQLFLLRELYGAIIIPRRVYEEVVVDGKGMPGAAEVEQAVQDGWIGIRAPASSLDMDMLQGAGLGLDRGESEAIVVALDLYQPLEKPLILVDESSAYAVVKTKFAQSLNVASLLHVLEECVLQGWVDDAEAKAILQRGFYRPAPAVERDWRQHRGQRPARPS